MKNIFAALFVFFSLFSAQAQEELAQDNFTQEKSFLIILSTKSYNAALRRAQKACNELGLTLDLNGNIQDKEEGLTNNEVCGCGLKHGYIPRGRSKPGEYVSIEYSTAFEGFAEGYYIVVVSSGDRAKVEEILPEVKEVYKDAYIKNSAVYMGCMH